MDIKKLFKHKKSFKKGGLSASPDFFWQILLAITFLIVLFATAFGIYTFIQVNKAPIFEMSNNIGKRQIINKERIDNVLSYFSDRLEKTDQILISPAPVVDPSL